MKKTKPFCSIHTSTCLSVPKRSSSTTTTKKTKQASSHEEWRTTFEQYAKRNNLSPPDWYQLSSNSLDEKTRQLVSQKFGGSLYRALSTLFPETQWKELNFQDDQNQTNPRKFFDDLGHTLGINTLDDWYEKISLKKIRTSFPSELHGQDKTLALMAAYPEHNWQPWKFNRVSAGYWNDMSNQRKFFDDLGKQLGVQKMDDWYSKLSQSAIEKNGGGGLLVQYYSGSPTAALMAVYSDYKWIPWKFSVVPKGFWNSKDNVKQFLEDLAQKLSINTLDDWYHVSTETLNQLGATSLVNKHKGLYNLLKEQYPGHPWDPNKFKKVEKNKNVSSTSREEWKTAFVQYAKQHNMNPNDWYQVSPSSLDDTLWNIISTHFGGSLYRTLSTVFPEIEWKAWKFEHQGVPLNFWKDQSNHRKFFDDLGKTLGVKNLDDWYEKLSNKEVGKHGGLKIVQEKPAVALMAAYPEHNWIPWKFSKVPSRYWNDMANQRKFFDELGKQLGIQKMDDWYSKLSQDAIINNGGGGLLQNVYHGSPTAALMAVYPDHKWIPWKFSIVPKGFWNSKDNVKQFLEELSEKLSIKTLDDWYLVDQEVLKQLGASGLLFKYAKLYNLLKEQYPHHPWDPNKFKNPGKKTQRWLVVTLKKMFPNEEILEDYVHPKAVFPTSKRPIQLDVFIPSRSLAFEYQGEQHYQDTMIFVSTRAYQQRDEEKRVACAANNIKLIEVPYWWNKTQQELQRIIGDS